MSYKIRRRKLLEVLRETKGDGVAKKEHLLTFLTEEASMEMEGEVKRRVNEFFSKLFHKLNKCNRLPKARKGKRGVAGSSTSKSTFGRPKTHFSGNSERSKRRKTERATLKSLPFENRWPKSTEKKNLSPAGLNLLKELEEPETKSEDESE